MQLGRAHILLGPEKLVATTAECKSLETDVFQWGTEQGFRFVIPHLREEGIGNNARGGPGQVVKWLVVGRVAFDRLLELYFAIFLDTVPGVIRGMGFRPL